MILLTGILGADFWYIRIADIIPGVPEIILFKHIMVTFVFLNIFVFGGSCLIEIASSCKDVSEMLSGYLRLIPAFCILASYFFFDQTDPFFQDHASLFYFVIGMIFSLVTSKLIVSTMAKVSLL